MREDMAKVIVERPRIQAFKTRKGRTRDLEDLPCREGMRRGHALRGDRKQLNENLAPLRRYLASQVGRPWNKVYSEIAARLRIDNTVQQHVRDHLRDFVAIMPRRDINDWRSSIRGGLWWQELYVDPRTGLLCRTDRLLEEKARRRARQHQLPPAVHHVSLTEDCELRLIKGFWYEVRLRRLPEPAYRAEQEIVQLPLMPYQRNGRSFEAEMEVRYLVTLPVYDVATRCLIAVGPSVDTPDRWKIYRREQPCRHYAIAKRVLSHQELRQHGVSNVAPEAG